MPRNVQRLKETSLQTFKTLQSIAPMLFAVMGLVGIFETFVTPEMIHKIFNAHAIHDMLLATTAGAVSVGQPFLSYIIGGELLDEGISMYAVTAFILSFVTLGIIQIPLEFSIFGARFTIVRNLLSFLFAIVIAYMTTLSTSFLSGYFS